MSLLEIWNWTIDEWLRYQMKLRCELNSTVQEVFQFKISLVYLLTIQSFNIDTSKQLLNSWNMMDKSWY